MRKLDRKTRIWICLAVVALIVLLFASYDGTAVGVRKLKRHIPNLRNLVEANLQVFNESYEILTDHVDREKSFSISSYDYPSNPLKVTYEAPDGEWVYNEDLIDEALLSEEELRVIHALFGASEENVRVEFVTRHSYYIEKWGTIDLCVCYLKDKEEIDAEQSISEHVEHLAGNWYAVITVGDLV